MGFDVTLGLTESVSLQDYINRLSDPSSFHPLPLLYSHLPIRFFGAFHPHFITKYGDLEPF